MTIVTLVVIGFALLAAIAMLWVLVAYNGLVRGRLRTQEAWSAITVQLRRRADLVPNLVETVKAYAGHERGALEGVTRARAALERATGPVEAGAADTMLTEALRHLFVVVEAYPQLKASEPFMALQRELPDVEDKVAYARQFYNRNVLDYNARIGVFPTSLVASAFGFNPAEFFQEEGLPAAVRVDFGRVGPERQAS